MILFMKAISTKQQKLQTYIGGYSSKDDKNPSARQ